MVPRRDRRVASPDSASQPLFRSPSPGDPHPLTEGNSAAEATSSPPHIPGQTKPKHTRCGRQAAAQYSRAEIQFRRGALRFLRKARSPHRHPTAWGDRSPPPCRLPPCSGRSAGNQPVQRRTLQLTQRIIGPTAAPMPTGKSDLAEDRFIIIDPVRSSGPDDLELEIAQPKTITDPEITISQCL